MSHLSIQGVTLFGWASGEGGPCFPTLGALKRKAGGVGGGREDSLGVKKVPEQRQPPQLWEGVGLASGLREAPTPLAPQCVCPSEIFGIISK